VILLEIHLKILLENEHLLVIAPILGNGTHEGKDACCAGDKTEMTCGDSEMGKCDMSKCATMTKDECAAMCHLCMMMNIQIN
jgi:hypothetical protein